MFAYKDLAEIAEWGHPLFRLHGYPDHQDVEAVWASEHQCQHLLSPSALAHDSNHRAGMAE